MKPALCDTTLSTAILDAVKAVLQFTQAGAAMPSEIAQDVVIRLSAAQKLASLMERELSIHRFSEIGTPRQIADTIEQTATATVISVNFDGGRKK